MPDVIFFPLAILMLWLAHRWRPSRLVGILALGLIASVAVRPFHLNQEGTLLAAFIIDIGVIAAMGEPWTQHPNKRAWSIALVGAMVKLPLTVGSYEAVTGRDFTHSDWHHYALALGLAYLLQVTIAGGFLDVAGRWVDHYMRRHYPRRYLNYWHVE